MHAGTADDKAKLLFDMNDLSGNGKLSKDDFKAMLRYALLCVVGLSVALTARGLLVIYSQVSLLV